MCEAHAAQAAADHGVAEVPGARVYAVKGMTCDCCATSVTEAMEQVPGVSGVDVDRETGRVVVLGDGFADEAIRAAVDGAGYELAAS